MKPNRTIFIIAFALLHARVLHARVLHARVLHAQTDSSTHKKTHWYQAVRLNFPEFILDYVRPFRNPSFSTLPYGMDQYMYPTNKGVVGTMGITTNYRFRLIGLFYKDRFGLELYRGGFGVEVPVDPFKNYLQTKFSNYYNIGLSDWPNTYVFSGWQYGLAYKHHWKKGWVIEPKFILGFEKMHSGEGYWYFKEMGSNQFTNYTMQYWDSSRNNHSYHIQLRLAKRFQGKKDGPWNEVGLKTEYITSAKKTLYVLATEKPYGKPEVDEGTLVHMRFQSVAVGLFFTMYLKNWIHN